MKKLVIIGTGEISKVVSEYFQKDSTYEIVAYAENNDYIKKDSFNNLKIFPLETIEDFFSPLECEIFVALGNGQLNYCRTKIYNYVKKLGYKCASYISSRAFVWDNVPIGENCLILENNVIQPYTAIGNNVFMWSGNHLGHSSQINNNCFISSHVVISGMCIIGENTFIGVNSTIADNITIGRDNYIAMATAINKNTDDNSIYKGNPPVCMPIGAKEFCKVDDSI